MLLLMLLTGVGGVKAQNVYIDELTWNGLGLPGNKTSYTEFSNKKFNSDALYSGQAASNNGAYIQLRKTNPSGIVTTQSGGKVKSVTIAWSGSTPANRYVTFYGKTSAYQNGADLYNNNSKGEEIGKITKPDKNGDDANTITLALEGDYEYLGILASAAVYINKITITWEKSNSSLSDAGLAYEFASYEATLDETFTAPQLTNPYNLSVTYTSSDANVATVASDGAVTLVGAGTTTITASFAGNDTYAAGSASYTLTVVDPNAPGTENNPFTIEQAIAYINSDSYNASDVVYVMGIISQIDSYNSNYKSITYWISDDGTDKNQFECYSGRGLDNSDFNSVEDLEQGDVVVVCGTVKKYSTIYEFNYNNYIVSLTRKTTPTLSFAEETYSVVKNGNMTISATTNSDGTISYESSDTDVAEIDASTGVVTAKAAGTTTITATVAATDTYKAATATVELTVTAPKHKATFYQNGEKLSEAEFTEDATIEFPDAMATILGKQFVGWLPAEIEGTTNEASPVKTATMGTADVTYYAVYAYVEGEEKSSTLTNGDIKEYFTKEKPSYGTLKSYSDEINGVTWSASCNADAAGRPWIQIKKEADAYFKVNTKGKIANIKLTITSATNSSGGVADITKHTAFSGTVYMEETASASPQGALGSSSDVTNNSVTLVPTSSVDEVIIQVSAAARIWDAEVTYGSATYSGYCTTLTLAAPTFSLAAGEVEKGTEVTITAEEGATLKYTIGETTTTAGSNTVTVTINEDVTIKAVAVKDGVESEEVSAAYTVKAEEPVVEPGTPATIAAGFYTIKNLGNEKFVNVAGRKTVTFVDETATAPGTVIKVESNEKGQVQVLRSQGVDLPGYAERAMKYVPKIVQLVAEKLGAEGEGNLLGKDGLGKIMDKFNESFDYHLYTEQGEQGVRIYGKTPSMQPVVDFYKDNKANVDAKLPMLEDFINSAINKVLEKTGGSGASILTEFSLHEIWDKMGKTLKEPVDADSKLEFLQGVLSNKQYVWDFAYQTAMKYWKPLINHKMVQQKLSELGDLAQYVEKIEYIRPDVKYYIVQKDGKIDFISQDNTLLKETSSEWELTERKTFTVNFDEKNVQKEKYYTTLYTDFAYTLPTGVKAMTVTKVAELNGKNIAITETIEGAVPAQTPVLLESATAGDVELTLDVTDGTAIENLLKGNDWLVNLLNITTPQVDKLFGIVHDLLEYENMGSLYDRYVKEYEYLKKRNAGTVNNKYFFALSGDDIAEAPGKTNVCQFTKDEQGLAFSYNLGQSPANKAFLPGDKDLVYLSFVGDVNRDGKVSVADVNALVEIVLGKVTEADNTKNYDFEAAHVNADEDITIADVTALVNIILGKTQN